MSRRYVNQPYDVQLPSTQIKDIHRAIHYLTDQGYDHGADFNVMLHDGYEEYTTFVFTTKDLATEFALRFW